MRSTKRSDDGGALRRSTTPVVARTAAFGSWFPWSSVTQCAAVNSQRSPISEAPQNVMLVDVRTSIWVAQGDEPTAAGCPPTTAGSRADAEATAESATRAQAIRSAPRNAVKRLIERR
jgi:hypothetical protein